MKKIISAFIFILTIASISACTKSQVDLIVYNANIYTVDDNFSKAEALAVKDGKFVAIGNTQEITSQYQAKETIDAKQQFIYPGLIDAHCHFYGLGTTLQQVNLMGTSSFEDVLKLMQDFNREKQLGYITGRGWDNEDWEIKDFPTNERLNQLWPNIPVVVRRVDGHAALANDFALKLAGFTPNTTIDGGELLVESGKLTGLLIDNAADTILKYAIPKPDLAYNTKALIDAEKTTLSYGLTTMSDAGLDVAIIDLIDSLQQAGEIQSRIYAMISATDKNISEFEKRGAWFKDKLQVNSVKFYLDGALGSRGACLLKPYHDKPEWSGFLLNSIEDFKRTAQKVADLGFQLNTHCIGDSANHIAIETYANLTKDTDLRWRIEHAQVIDKDDFEAFKNPNIIPSVQPTHATSDMYWAENRLGSERIHGAYAYQDLLNAHSKIALGTDFPVEQVSPFLTFYAAVSRQDLEGYPEGGFEPNNALSREDALRGMTIWAAYANKQEKEVGSIETGKKADFVIMNTDWMKTPLIEIPNTKVNKVYIGGSLVYNR